MVTSLCPDDAVLLEVAVAQSASTELQTHLDTCVDCQKRLQQVRQTISSLQAVGAELHASLVETLPTPTTPSERQATIGKYFIAGTLGAGGQAVVYRALHPTLGKDVVVKLSRKAMQPGQSHLLVNEGKVLAKLEHPNLVRVFDLDFHEGRPFLVMEYIRGGGLAKRAGETRWTPYEAADLVARVVRAVAVAHQSGITHQDIKPENILMDDDGVPHLADFGMAHLKVAVGDTGQVIGGTPHYMAPEQAKQDAEQVGPASDIYGLGGVLYFLLVGKTPRAGHDVVAVLEKAARGEVDWQALEQCGAPRRLVAICRRALAVKPNDRYPSADALAGELEQFARSRQRRRVLAACALILAAALGLTYALWPEPLIVIPADKQYLIHVVRRGSRDDPEIFPDLKSALPLLSGDRFQVQCDLPRRHRAALYMLDSQGKLDRLTDVTVARAGPYDRLTYPGGGSLVKLTGPPGTEFLLVCASRGPLPADALAALLAAESPWPALPRQVLIRLDRDAVTVELPRALVIDENDRLGTVKARIEKLRLQLLELCDFFAGVAFPHLK